jgi:hypothetical protein
MRIHLAASLPVFLHRGQGFITNRTKFLKKPAIASQSRVFYLNATITMTFRERTKMKTSDNKVPTEFGPNTRFAPAIVNATPAQAFRGAIEDELERLKERLLAAELERTTTLEANVLLRRAANEAASLVWLTPYPLLLLPALFAEKARSARRHVGRQALIRERSSELLALAE